MIVTVHALFSNADKIGAKVIASGTAHLAPTIKEKVSHVALLVNGRWVHESTGKTGVSVISYDLWSKIHKEVARVPLKTREYQEIADKFREIKGKKYDYLGILFFGLSIVPTFLGVKLPKKNRWESPNRYFCCEALGYLTGHYYGMSAPVQILDRLQNG